MKTKASLLISLLLITAFAISSCWPSEGTPMGESGPDKANTQAPPTMTITPTITQIPTITHTPYPWPTSTNMPCPTEGIEIFSLSTGILMLKDNEEMSIIKAEALAMGEQMEIPGLYFWVDQDGILRVARVITDLDRRGVVTFHEDEKSLETPAGVFSFSRYTNLNIELAEWEEKALYWALNGELWFQEGEQYSAANKCNWRQE